MLTHIVCWKYKDETTEAMVGDHTESLRSLPRLIPNIVSFAVGSDILHLERSFDTALIAVFSGRSAFDAYTDHPEHQKVALFGREISK